MKKSNCIAAILLSAIFATGILAGCGNKNTEPEIETKKQTEEVGSETKNSAPIKFAVIKGPSGIGSVKLMEDAEKGESQNKYEFQILNAPDEAAAKIVSGEVDVVALPPNSAAALYQKTGGEIKIAALSTLGVLYLLENGNTIDTVEDLKGKTIYSSGQGATPEYVLNFILQKNGLADTKVEYKSEHAELAAALLAGQIDNAVLPEPNVTAVLLKNPDIRIALDLAEEWKKACEGSENEGSVLAMGCIAVRADFLKENKEAFDAFLAEYKASTQFANTDVAETASLVEKYKIMASVEAAEKAIPNCNITYIDGDEMKESIKNYYQVLFEANPKSIGGSLPNDDFYYKQ